MQLPHIVSSTLTVTRCYLNIIALVFLSTWNQSTRPQATDQSQAKCVGLHITTHDDMITKSKEQHARDCQPAKCRFKNTWDEHKCFVLWWESSQSKHVYRVCLPKGQKDKSVHFLTEVTLLLLLRMVVGGGCWVSKKLTVPPGGDSHQKRQACEQVWNKAAIKKKLKERDGSTERSP